MITPVRISTLRAGARGGPAFLPTARPALSWAVDTELSGWRQQSYQLEIEALAAGIAAIDSITVETAESQAVAWPFSPLGPYDSARIRVTVTGVEGSTSAPSEWLTVRTGPLTGADWTAEFITADVQPGDGRGTQRFRTTVTPRAEVAEAVLSVTAHGIYEASIDGTPVGDEVLTPGWTTYKDRLLFQTYDVTTLLTQGRASVLGATVAEGWYGERFGFDGAFQTAYPGPVALSAQLRIRYTDGTVETVPTDHSWQATTTGPVVKAGIYPGETFDARLDDAAMRDAASELPDAVGVRVVERDRATLAPSSAPPIRRIETVKAQRVFTSPRGATLVDFGQNLVGWLELTIDAPEGTEITLRHAEVLENGELGTRPLRFAEATDRYIARGDGSTTWSPSFTFHGFRYAEVTGWPGEFSTDDITAVVVHNDMVRTGWLETSNSSVNQLLENVRWGMRGNFLSIPSDCPQRDERLGWTGDIQVFARTASYLYDVSGFLGSWLRDVDLDQQRAGGVVPMVVPNPITGPAMAAAAWGDAATLVPDALFERYGDAAVLEAQYESMRSWVDTVDRLAGDDHLWAGGFQFGDWLDPSAPPENPAAAKTHPDIVATAYFARSAERLARAAATLGHEADARRYDALANAVREAFVTEYVTPAGRLMSDAHTAYALAIAFDLLRDPALVSKAGARLAELVRSHAFRIGTGFVGTPLICDALCRSGQADVAFRLLLEEGCPSWLYPITMGATTVWERWDSMLPDGTINPGEMTSFNHYALGAVADWIQRSVGGIAPAEPGYQMIDIAPILGGGLTHSTARFDSGYGPVEVSWRLENGTFTLTAEIPPNTTARVLLPGASDPIEVGSGHHSFTAPVAGTTEAPPAFSLDSSLSEIVQHTEVRDGLENLFRELGYFIGLGWTAGGRWKSGTPVRASLIMMGEDDVQRVADYLEGASGR